MSDQSTTKAPPDGTRADSAVFSGWAPVDAASFGQILTGQLVIDVTSNWGAS